MCNFVVLVYSLRLFYSYSGFMQQGIKSNPSLVQKLRATFLKVKKKCKIMVLYKPTTVSTTHCTQFLH